MALLELSDYTLAPIGPGNGLSDFYFSLSEGDACAVCSDSDDDATLFLKGLATLVYPVKGTYRFEGQPIDLSNYRNALPCKKKIGYIAPDSAMISNQTVRENLLFRRYFYEDSLALELDGDIIRLCRQFDVFKNLDMTPGELRLNDIRIAIIVRELSQAPMILLLDRPEDLIDHTKFDLFIDILKEMLLSKLSIVFFSFDTDFADMISNTKVMISNGRLTTVLKNQ